MAYIGSTPTSQNFISGTDYFNGTGSQTAFTLTRTVNSVNDVEVVVNNVIQQPNSYTVSGTTLTLSAAPSSGTSNVYVRYISTTTQVIAPAQGTVNTASIVDNAITAAKMGANGTWAPAGTVLQVVQGTTSTETTNSTNTFADTGLSASITPRSSNSKILVLVNHSVNQKSTGSVDNSMSLRIVRNSTTIASFADYLGYTNSALLVYFSASYSYLDSPATTSSTTYKTQFASSFNSSSVRICTNNTPATITLLEIAA